MIDFPMMTASFAAVGACMHFAWGQRKGETFEQQTPQAVFAGAFIAALVMLSCLV
jgi:hypothetical protein